MKKCIALLIVAVSCLGVFQAAIAGEEAASKVIRPYVVLTGPDSRIETREYRRITSDADWIKTWKKHFGKEESQEYDSYFDPLGLPLVDFESCMVIAVFQGSDWNSAGLKVVSVVEASDRIVLRFDDKAYQTAGPDGGGKKVAVYGFFVLPRSDKPVVLEEDVQGLIGHPPVWEERIRFEVMQAVE